MRGILCTVVAMGIVAAGTLAGSAWAAPVVDPLDDTSNLAGWVAPPGTIASSATDNGNGTVTLTRNEASVDAGVDWMLNSHLSLTPDHNTLIVQPVTDAANDFYSISLLFFQGASFTGEIDWVLNSNADTTQTLADVSAIAPAGSDNYFVRFRIQPFETAGASFRFTEIRAVPEPAMALLAASGLIAVGRRRRRRVE